MKKLLLTLFGAVFLVAAVQAQTFEDVTAWEDTAPSGGNMALTVTNETAALGINTGRGNIGVWDSNRGGQYENYNSGKQNWSLYAGKDYTLTVDIYLTAAQAAQANITDDTFYSSVAGVNKTWKSVGSFTPDAWNTYTRTGTFSADPNALTNVQASVLVNDKGTHPPAAPNLFVDNYKLVVHNVEVPPKDVLWDERSPSGSMFSNIPDPFGTGHGSIGEFSSTSGGQWENINSGSHDWSAYAGMAWTLSVDLYITAAQAADADIIDDNFFYNVGGVQAGYKDVSTLIPDTWNTVTWTGVFDSDPNALTNTICQFVNNDKATHPASGSCYYGDNFKLVATAPARDTLWEDPAPEGRNMLLTLVTNAYGTGIGEFDSTLNTGQWQNYTEANQDWSAYAGLDWKFSIDVYITSNQLADAGIVDDQIYYSVGGVNGGYTTISNAEWVADSWNTISWFGTFDSDPNALTNTSCGFLDNDQGTDPASGANYYFGSFKLEADQLAPPVYVDVTNTIEFVSAEGFVNGSVSGQVKWVESSTNGDFIVNAASPGTATATNNGVNMALTNPINGLKPGDTVSFEVDFQFQGTPADISGTNNVFNGYWMNAGLTTTLGSGGAIGDSKPYAEAVRFQRFFTTNSAATSIRLFQNAWTGPASGSLGDLAENDELRIQYNLTLGSDAASSSLSVTLVNVTQATNAPGDTYTLSSSELYDALVSADSGAYFYVEANTLNQGITGLQVDRVEITYPQLYVEYGTPFEQWMADNGYTGAPEDNNDGDDLTNYQEYLFDGNPDVPDTGILPVFDAGTGDYIFSLRADDTLTYIVVTTENLVFGPWVTNSAPVAIIKNDLGMDSYTEAVGTSANNTFIKLIVE